MLESEHYDKKACIDWAHLLPDITMSHQIFFEKLPADVAFTKSIDSVDTYLGNFFR